MRIVKQTEQNGCRQRLGLHLSCHQRVPLAVARSEAFASELQSLVKVMKTIRLLIGLIPAFVLAVWAWSLSVHEWFDVPSPVFLLAPGLAIIGGVPWFIHSRSPRLPTVQLICVAAALLTCVIRIDWIVGTYYVYMDSRPTYQTHVAPSAPLWSPPTPNDTIQGTKSWDDFDYFYHGGAGGPTETPRLRLNWLAAISRFWSYLLVAYSACLLVIPKHNKPKANKTLHPTADNAPV